MCGIGFPPPLHIEQCRVQEKQSTNASNMRGPLKGRRGNMLEMIEAPVALHPKP